MANVRQVSVSFGLNNKTVGEVKAFLDKLPDEARIRINHTAGDRPWESSTTNMTAVWEEPL